MQDPSPFSFAPSQLWHGNDGNWSSFDVRVGSPEQNFRVLPSAATGELIVPHAKGCEPSGGSPANCASLRGVLTSNRQLGFAPNLSTTWQQLGWFEMGLEPKLGYSDTAVYGKDSVGLLLPNSGGPTLANQTIGAVRRKPFFVGFFGLSPLASNFTDFSQPQRSYLSGLRDEGIIPSLSYAYNAGAYYKSPKIYGSLTLGGYDESRFEPNDFTFPFDTEETQATSLKLQQITAERTFNGSTVLLQEESYVNIDFTMPYLWLPGHVCDRIAASFRLHYDNATELYLVDDATHTDLVARNPSLTFSFGNPSSISDRLDIHLPYAAFDLQASWPIYNDTKNYFPLRRAANATQLTLGRAFMQEAYIIVDFERGNFSLHQAVFAASNAQKIVSISAENHPRHQEPESLGKRSIAGVVTGIVIFTVLLITLTALLICRRRQRRHARSVPMLEDSDSNERKETTSELPEDVAKREQLMSSEVLELSCSRQEELDGKCRWELA